MSKAQDFQFEELSDDELTKVTGTLSSSVLRDSLHRQQSLQMVSSVSKLLHDTAQSMLRKFG